MKLDKKWTKIDFIFLKIENDQNQCPTPYPLPFKLKNKYDVLLLIYIIVIKWMVIIYLKKLMLKLEKVEKMKNHKGSSLWQKWKKLKIKNINAWEHNESTMKKKVVEYWSWDWEKKYMPNWK